MNAMQDEVARERARDARRAAADHRMAHRAQRVQRWQRVAAWAEHRSDRAQRELRDSQN